MDRRERRVRELVIKKLESVRIDVKNGIGHIEVNGNDISSNGSYLNLTFENGEWSLMTTRDEVYSTSDREVKE